MSKSKKKGRKGKKKNVIKASRSVVGKLKYDLVNKLNPGSTNKMMGELRSHSLIDKDENDATFKFEAEGNYKPLNLTVDEESPQINITEKEERKTGEVIKKDEILDDTSEEYASQSESDSQITEDDGTDSKYETQKAELDDLISDSDAVITQKKV
jgi:DNA replicative helicase MCM subunit Mcm2 (Cdc46/Mcm family)